MRARGLATVINESWGRGAEGGEALAMAVLDEIGRDRADVRPIYPDDMPLMAKIETIAREIYRASDVVADASVVARLQQWEQAGYGRLPICVAKTQYSFSADPSTLGAPEGFAMPLHEVRLRAGPGYIVALMGE